MQLKQFNYSTRQEAIDKAGLDFIKSFYERPDNLDREWNTYKADEEWKLDTFKQLLESEPLRLTSTLIIYADTMEITAILEFEKGCIQEKTRNQFLDILTNAEQWNFVRWIGVDAERIVYGESY